MDNMLEHPWSELQALIKEKWLTQKAFASILWKKVSEVNELLKWKRNITIQRDYLLHQTLWTPIKYWILKQVDYDYSLLDIEESPDSPLLIGEGQGEVSSHQTSPSEHSKESISDDLSSWATVKDLRWETIEQNTPNSSSQTSQSDSTDINQNDSKESVSQQTIHFEPKENENLNISPLDKGDTAKPRGFEQPQETAVQE